MSVEGKQDFTQTCIRLGRYSASESGTVRCILPSDSSSNVQLQEYLNKHGGLVKPKNASDVLPSLDGGEERCKQPFCTRVSKCLHPNVLTDADSLKPGSADGLKQDVHTQCKIITARRADNKDSESQAAQAFYKTHCVQRIQL